VGEHRDFKFSLQVDHSKSLSMVDKLSLKRVWLHHVTHFKFLVPLKYLWNILSQRLQVWCTSWS